MAEVVTGLLQIAAASVALGLGLLLLAGLLRGLFRPRLGDSACGRTTPGGARSSPVARPSASRPPPSLASLAFL